MKLTCVLFALVLCGLAGACGYADAPRTPTAPPATSTPVATPTPAYEADVEKTVSDILNLRIRASELGLYSDLGSFKSDSCAGLSTFGYSSDMFDSIWPDPYKSLDHAVASFCSVIELNADNGQLSSPLEQEALTIVFSEKVEPFLDAVKNDETFDIRGAVRARAAERQSGAR